MTSAAEIEAQMRQRLLGLDEGRSIDPTELARALAGPDEKVWRRLMGPIRGTAIRLALAGDATILRKGKQADPNDFKGVYRIGRPSEAVE
ncbi:Protein of unknown function [Kaistia soli DSM 19436]|uniref:DUF3253 domain-containing protein n=1 Tax=Kaistia soli DSM 19436 TaxID=1122133 RepID=A0A1M5H0Z7_9HYPH|nr:DUF3253 domain-containing protein [Kaistia soli]SHG09556.1 Protein of unknown function [Kaistia soli DSM 19436]